MRLMLQRIGDQAPYGWLHGFQQGRRLLLHQEHIQDLLQVASKGSNGLKRLAKELLRQVATLRIWLAQAKELQQDASG